MCLSHEMIKLRSPRSRRLQREPLKPRLSRKIVAGARVNLNLYWAKFEEIARKNCRLDNEINENLANELKELGN
ncbi:hypothetical protein TcasGA2_TC006577 [Tribolium castaneum]|uniref:Uncharacterized protein n=1 Tax=Tribolium castaneum TaxID=7070 RepID=D6WXN1_TRICA|nr:hypothetical protein TcasGA2_TC006577 [Tribolium castaneum]